LSLIKSISGIRGTIGGRQADNLTPIDVVECVAGFGTWVKKSNLRPTVVVGRDGRISGSMVSQLSIQTLISMGINVIDLDYSTTPTVEMYVKFAKADAGIIFTASHNPKDWNALKFLNRDGEFISPEVGEEILHIIKSKDIVFNDVNSLGNITKKDDAISYHINEILQNKFVDRLKISQREFHVVVDCINSTGAISVPLLLDKLGVKYTLINENITGDFAHNPEPLPAHLGQLSDAVVSLKAEMGISIDPDVDRLAFVSEDGSMFGEEYTLVAIADHVLSIDKGNTVSNLSSTRALADITEKHGGNYYASAVGEVNVVNEMKRVNAVIGGEGNGGVILPNLHYGRDALAGIALFLTYVANKDMSLTQIKNEFPSYIIIKDKIDIKGIDLENIFARLRKEFSSERINETDGFKIDFEKGWVHIRKSNTEPIARIYAEAKNEEVAKSLLDKVKSTF
jgi:phosphomannomutase